MTLVLAGLRGGQYSPAKRMYDQTCPSGTRWGRLQKVDVRPASARAGTGTSPVAQIDIAPTRWAGPIQWETVRRPLLRGAGGWEVVRDPRKRPGHAWEQMHGVGKGNEASFLNLWPAYSRKFANATLIHAAERKLGSAVTAGRQRVLPLRYA